jgi:hypothetical protein
MIQAWPTGLDGLPLPEIPLLVEGYATQWCAVVLTLDDHDLGRLLALWPKLANGFWFPAADGSGMLTLEPLAQPTSEPLGANWWRVRFDARVISDDG